MPASHFDFYAANATRGYPLDDAATATDDAGRLVPPALLVDCRLRWPDSAGRYAFVGAISATPGLVTAVFLVADGPARPATGAAVGGTAVPIAAVTLRRPVQPGRAYPVEALYPGAGGWVVFGPGIEDPYSGRFSSVAQGQLLARCARPYRTPPIPSIGKEFVAPPLSGLVRILVGPDIEVIKASRTVQGAPTDCLVVRLADDLNRNVLSVYAGPCAGRPEAGTCPNPGVETINAVTPDCTGNIEIEFRGAQSYPYAGGGGLEVDLAVGLAGSCPPPAIPDATGRLPGEYFDTCSSESLSLPDDPVDPIPPPPVDSSESIGLGNGLECVGLPLFDQFDSATLDPRWHVTVGAYAFAPDDSPESTGSAVQSVALTDASRRNVLIWDDCGYPTTLGLTCITQVKLAAGAAANGGLVLNYHLVGEVLRPNYHLLLANALTNGFELWFYNGSNLSMLTGLTLPNPYVISPGLWYELTAATSLGPTGRVVINATLRSVEQPDVPDAMLSVAVSGYLPATGRMGLGTDLAVAEFAYFGLAES